MSPVTNPDDVSTPLGLLRDSLSSEEERIRAEGGKAMHATFNPCTSVFIASSPTVPTFLL